MQKPDPTSARSWANGHLLRAIVGALQVQLGHMHQPQSSFKSHEEEMKSTIANHNCQWAFLPTRRLYSHLSPSIFSTCSVLYPP